MDNKILPNTDHKLNSQRIKLHTANTLVTQSDRTIESMAPRKAPDHTNQAHEHTLREQEAGNYPITQKITITEMPSLTLNVSITTTEQKNDPMYQIYRKISNFTYEENKDDGYKRQIQSMNTTQHSMQSISVGKKELISIRKPVFTGPLFENTSELRFERNSGSNCCALL